MYIAFLIIVFSAFILSAPIAFAIGDGKRNKRSAFERAIFSIFYCLIGYVVACYVAAFPALTIPHLFQKNEGKILNVSKTYRWVSFGKYSSYDLSKVSIELSGNIVETYIFLYDRDKPHTGQTVRVWPKSKPWIASPGNFFDGLLGYATIGFTLMISFIQLLFFIIGLKSRER